MIKSDENQSMSFRDAIQNIALSQMLDAEMGRLAEASYYAVDIDEIRGTLLGIAAMAEKSISLNAQASEALQDLQSRFEESSLKQAGVI